MKLPSNDLYAEFQNHQRVFTKYPIKNLEMSNFDSQGNMLTGIIETLLEILMNKCTIHAFFK